MKRPAIFAVVAAGIGVACAFDLPEPTAGSELTPGLEGGAGSTSSGEAGTSTSSGSTGTTSTSSTSSGTVASPCSTGTWLFCEDFEEADPFSRWKPGIEKDGANVSLNVANGVMTSSLPAASGMVKKAHGLEKVDLTDTGLHLEFDAFIHNTQGTDNYVLLECHFAQSTASPNQTLTIYEDDAYVAVTSETPAPDMLKADTGVVLPKNKWLHIVFDIKPNESNGSAILSYRVRDQVNDPLTEIVNKHGMNFSINQGTRTATCAPGLVNYNVTTPDLSVDYDNFAISRLP